MDQTLTSVAERRVRASNLYDLGVIGAILLAPVITMELWFATYDSYYLRRDVHVELGSRIAGNVFTASVNCPRGDGNYTPMFRAWDEADAEAFLADRHAGCYISEVMSGKSAYRKRIWTSSSLLPGTDRRQKIRGELS